MIQELKLREPNIIDDIASLTDFVRAFFGWWYGDVPIFLFSTMSRTLQIIDDKTSFSLVLRGYFQPWKKDYDAIGMFIGLTIKTVYLPIVLFLFLLIIASFVLLLLVQLALMPVILGLIFVNPFIAP
jgi:hypothetical protein